MRNTFFNCISRVQRFYCQRKMEGMRKVFVRHVKDEDLMKVTFVFGDSSFPDREFNFMRSKKEQLDSALKRMKAKVEGSMLSSLLKKKKKKVKNEICEDNASADISFHVFRDGRKLDGDVSNADAWIQGSQLVINDIPYEVVENAPEVSYLNLPKSILAGFPVYPKICLEYSEMDDSSFIWYRSLTKSEVENYPDYSALVNKKGTCYSKIHDGFIYMTTRDDVGRHLMVVCIPRLGTRSGKEGEAISLKTVSDGPEFCPFEKRHKHTKELTGSGSMRCISYNILADQYADTDTARDHLFAHCPSEFLDLDYRRQLYLKEILGYNGDLLCLQEVDKKVFQNDLVPFLSAAGLEGVYCEKGGTVTEGLSCFYRTSKFKKIFSDTVILSEVVKKDPLFNDIWSKIQENEKLTDRMLNRTTALQVILLECLDVPKKRVLVANTHLYFHPDSDNIRLIQGSLCIKFVENMKKKFQDEDPTIPVALVFCGDFNSCPKFGVLKLFTTGSISPKSDDWKSNPEEAIDGMNIQHGLALGSACGTPEYTNYTIGFNGCLDYIFYDKDFLSVKHVVPLPSHDEVKEFDALPNKVFPSDHIALVCTLTWL